MSKRYELLIRNALIIDGARQKQSLKPWNHKPELNCTPPLWLDTLQYQPT